MSRSAGLAITTVGACQRILDLVLEHVKQRQQFGVAIGTFQGRPAQRPSTCTSPPNGARALSYFAALTIFRPTTHAGGSPPRWPRAAAGECQSVVFRHGLQLFGAMGFTWENNLQFALKTRQGRRTAARRRRRTPRDHRGGIQE